MFYLIAMIFLLVALFNFVNLGFINFILMCAVSIGFCIAGAIANIAGFMSSIFRGEVKCVKKDLLNGGVEYTITKKENIENNQNN